MEDGSSTPTSGWRIDLKPLGPTKWSRVYKATRGSDVSAIKILSKTLSSKDLRYALREKDFLSVLDHPHIVKMLGFEETADDYRLYLRYYPSGDLYHHLITNSGRASDRAAARVVKQLLSALKYCHSNGIVHRDVKIDNVLVESGSISTGDIRVVLADFGLASRFDDDTLLTEWVGTPEYAAPELLSHIPYTTEPDVWTVGVVTYVLLTGMHPFRDDDFRRLNHLIINTEPYYPECVGRVARVFIRFLMEKDMRLRATIDEALDHQWVSLTT